MYKREEEWELVFELISDFAQDAEVGREVCDWYVTQESA